MLDAIERLIRQKQYQIYDFAILHGGAAEYRIMQKCAPYQNGYSVTKLLINTEIGVLCDCGLLRTEDFVIPLLRGQIRAAYDLRWENVRVHDLLTHKTGLDKSVIDIDRGDTHTYGTDDYLAFALQYGPVKPTGEYYCYTDISHYLLSRIIHALTGLYADDALRRDVLTPMAFRPAAFIKCPMGHPVGATGSFLYADDMAKLAQLYMNGGEYGGKQIISCAWTQRVKTCGYDFYPVQSSQFYGKGGMFGQMTISDGTISAAWHAFMEDSTQMEADILEILTDFSRRIQR